MGFPHVFPVFHMVFHIASQRNCRRLNAEYYTCALHSCRALPTSPCRRSLFFAVFPHRNAGVPSVPSLRTYHLFVPLRASPSGHCPSSITAVSPRLGSSAAAPLRPPPGVPLRALPFQRHGSFAAVRLFCCSPLRRPPAQTPCKPPASPLRPPPGIPLRALPFQRHGSFAAVRLFFCSSPVQPPPLRAPPSGHCPSSATEVSPRFGSSAAALLQPPAQTPCKPPVAPLQHCLPPPAALLSCYPPFRQGFPHFPPGFPQSAQCFPRNILTFNRFSTMFSTRRKTRCPKITFDFRNLPKPLSFGRMKKIFSVREKTCIFPRHRV